MQIEEKNWRKTLVRNNQGYLIDPNDNNTIVEEPPANWGADYEGHNKQQVSKDFQTPPGNTMSIGQSSEQESYDPSMTPTTPTDYSGESAEVDERQPGFKDRKLSEELSQGKITKEQYQDLSPLQTKMNTPNAQGYNKSSNTVKQLQGLEGLSQQLQDSSYDFNTVPDSIITAITQVESGGASQDSLDASFKSEGAVGPLQQRQIFQDEIARLDPSMKGYDPNDPEQARKAAKIYIAHQMKSGSDLDTAIRAYNAGRGGARKGLGGDYLNKVRRAYEQKERDYMNPVGYQPTVANESQDNSIFLQPSPIDSAWSNTMFKKGDYK